MGLESHVDRVLTNAGIGRGYNYYWSDGLRILDSPERTIKKGAKKIMRLLDLSGEFGPTRYDEETNKIEFGLFSDFFDGDLAEYKRYFRSFKKGLVDKKGRMKVNQNGQ